MTLSLRTLFPSLLLLVACASGGDGIDQVSTGGAGGTDAGAAGQSSTGGAAGKGGSGGLSGSSGQSDGGSAGAPSAGQAGAGAAGSDAGTSGGPGGAVGGSDAGSSGAGGSAGASAGGSPAGGANAGGANAGGSSAGASAGGANAGGSVPVVPGERAAVPGGSFKMGRAISGSDACPSGMKCFDPEMPEHTVSVSAFELDTYEVTVGRFRSFVDGYPDNRPAAGAGAHPKIAGSGWQSAWDASLPATQQALRTSLGCDESFATWTSTPGAGEDRPIACVSWYTAFAFCIADGGRLPTEAEWEMAAAGGDENRLYPWGAAAPDSTRASFGGVDGTNPLASVGTHPAGQARWGHHDLAGGRWEWVLDAFDSGFYAGAGASCSDCASLTGTSRTVRGGGWTSSEPSHMRSAQRYLAHTPTTRQQYLGFRCAH